MPFRLSLRNIVILICMAICVMAVVVTLSAVARA